MSQQFTISIPSKTFLTGEYAILNGGRAVVMSHGPNFKLKVTEMSEGECLGIHPKSPAGQFVRKNPAQFKDFKVEFEDPYFGAGGFGASSAQFVACYAWKHYQENLGTKNSWNVSTEEMWKSFRGLEFDGLIPSGGDVIAQALGGLSLIRTTPYEVKKTSWPFADLSCLIVPTGFKVPTFEHLRERLPVTDELMKFAEDSAFAFENGQSDEFVKSLRSFAEELESLSLVTASTRGIIAQIASLPEVLAVKGCGALGADVVLALVRPELLEVVRRKFIEQGLRVSSTSQNVGEGLKLEIKWVEALGSEANRWV